MKTIALALLLLLTPPALAAKNKSIELNDQGYGKIVYGVKLKELEKKLGEKATELDETFEEPCHYVKFKKYPLVALMVENGVVTRVDTNEMAKVPNPYGIKEGDLLADLKKKFPQMKVKDHTYDDEGHYLIFDSADGKRALYFTESKGKVSAGFVGGLKPSVGYVEGCL